MTGTSFPVNRKSKGANYLSKGKQVMLAERAMKGDSQAWGMLYDSFHKAVLGFIAGRTGNLDDAKDLCQDTFMKAEANLKEGKYDTQYSFYSFLRNIAVFVIMKYWGKSEDRITASSESDWNQEVPNSVEGMADERSCQEILVLRLEMLRLLSECCAKPHQIVAVELVKLLGWKPREVVAELSGQNLGSLTDMFFGHYFESFAGFVDKQTFCRYASPQLRKIRMSTAEVYIEPEYKSKLKEFQRTRVLELTLSLFYTARGEPSLHDWCNKVKTRIRNALEKGILCEGTASQGVGIG